MREWETGGWYWLSSVKHIRDPTVWYGDDPKAVSAARKTIKERRRETEERLRQAAADLLIPDSSPGVDYDNDPDYAVGGSKMNPNLDPAEHYTADPKLRHSD